MYKRKKMMGGYGMKKKMYGGTKMMRAGGKKYAAKNRSTGKIKYFDNEEAYLSFVLDSPEGANFQEMGLVDVPGTAPKPTAKRPNTPSAVSAAGKKVSRTPKAGMFYLEDEKGNFVFYPEVKDGASMRTAAEKMLPGSAGKVKQGTVDDIFMKERPDQMKKMKTKEAPKVDVKSDDNIIMKSREVKFDAPSKPKADGSKAVAKSKVDAAKAKQAKKTQRATDKAAKKAKAPSMRAEKRAVRQNTRQQIQDIKREGRQERKAIRRGMAEAGMMKKKGTGGMKKAQAGLKDAPEGNKGKGLRSLPKGVRNKMGYKKMGGTTRMGGDMMQKGLGGKRKKNGKMKDRRR